MSQMTIEEINTLFVADEYKKQLIHYFASAVVRQCAEMNTTDINEGYNQETYWLRQFSQAHTTDDYIIPLTTKDNLLKYFFEKDTAVPLYVWYWVEFYHNSGLGKISEYKIKSPEIVESLRKIYIEQKKIDRINERFELSVEKERRKQIKKIYKDGTHAEMFRIYSEKINNGIKHFTVLDTFTYTELENIGVMLTALFPKYMKLFRSYDIDTAFAYCLGRIQGKADVLNCQTKDNSHSGGYSI